MTFLIESTRERVTCLLNPESLTISRRSGIRSRGAVGSPSSMAAQSEDPVLFTGGGQTEMTLHLLFDVSLTESTAVVSDVRELTRPLQQLTQPGGTQRSPKPSVARFIWGKAWNVRGVVSTLAERIESFTPTGVPRRSWLRMQFVHLNDGVQDSATGVSRAPIVPESLTSGWPPISDLRSDPDLQIHEMAGGSAPVSGATERLDEIAERYYGNPSFWRVLALVNDIDDPLNVPVGTRLAVPSLSFLNRL